VHGDDFGATVYIGERDHDCHLIELYEPIRSYAGRFRRLPMAGAESLSQESRLAARKKSMKARRRADICWTCWSQSGRNVAALKKQGRSRDETAEAKPTAAFDAKWGNFVIDHGFFTRMVYEGV
jgi:hypothetical protein